MCHDIFKLGNTCIRMERVKTLSSEEENLFATCVGRTEEGKFVLIGCYNVCAADHWPPQCHMSAASKPG